MSTITSVSELDSLPGLHSAKRTLRGIFARGAEVHAVLLFGEEGAGKAALADYLCRYWLCKQPSAEGPCGACKACTSTNSGAIPDVLRVVPIGLSSWIPLRAIHECPPKNEEEVKLYPLQDFLRTMPIVARTKVVSLDRADRLTDDAAKALLKTLEEPEPYSRFVLTTTELSRVHTTIRSRCMIIPCELPTRDEWAAAVGEPEAWEKDLSRRSTGLTHRMRAHPDVFREIHELAAEVSKSRIEAALSFSERFKKLIDRLQKGEETNARSAAATALQALGAALSCQQISPTALQRIAKAHRRILGNVGAGLELDALFVRILAENER